MELEDRVYQRITHLSSEGDSLSDAGSHSEAIAKYQQALDMVPQPQRDWEASTWLHAAIGDAYFFSHDFKKAAEAFFEAYNCPGGLQNPFINLRIGECLFETGDLAGAEEYMLRAYMWEGKDIFSREKPKYVKFMSDKYNLD